MNNARAGTVAFGIIFLILIIFGVEFYDQVWSFPDFSPVPLMIIALVGTGIFVTVKLGFPQIRYFRHGIDVTRGIYDNPDDERLDWNDQSIIDPKTQKPFDWNVTN